ncbi:MAG: amino acid ABC transporter substrate-binding protein [Geminicoccaceae bacterium]
MGISWTVERSLKDRVANRESMMSASKQVPRKVGGQTRRDFVKTAGVAAGASVLFARAPHVLGQEKPIRIGASLSLTGKYARTGEEEGRGYQLWADSINQQGYSFGKKDLPNTSAKGLLGRPVELVILDDRSDPTTGVRLYNELIYNQKVDLLLGPYSSAVTNAVAPVLEQAQIPTPNPMASSTDIWTGRNLQWQVQIQPPASKRLPGLTETSAAHGDTTIAIIYEDTEFPRNSAEAIRDRATKDGMEIVLDEAYPTKLTDWTPIIQRVTGSGAAVVAGGGYLPDAIGITRAVRSLGYKPHILSLLVGVALPDFEETLGQDALTVTGDADWVTTVGFPGAQEYIEAYHAKYGGMPEYHSAGGYGGAQILEEAVKRVGNITDLEKIRDTMYSLKTTTVFNLYEVAPLDSPDAGLQLAADRVMLQVQEEGGKLVKPVVAPEAAASAEWIYPFA